MKKYLVCSLNDENYTQANYTLCNTFEEATKECIENCMNYYELDAVDVLYYMKLEKDNDDGTSWFYSYSDEDSFFVNQIFEIEVNEEDYICIWHHAYDGVDFKVIKIGTDEECIKAMDADSHKVLSECKEADVDFASECHICIDTSEEWEVWDVIKAVLQKERKIIMMTREEFQKTNRKMTYEEYKACYCPECSKQNCIHREAYRRFPQIDGGLGLCPNLKYIKKR